MSGSPTSALATAQHPQALISRSIHGKQLEQAIPDWLTGATAHRRQQLKSIDAPLPDWYRSASSRQRQVLNDSVIASFAAQTRLDKAMSALQDIDTFAEPLLIDALEKQFNVKLDVNRTFLLLRKTVEAGIFGIDIGSFEVLRLPLLQAALHNFEAWECERGAFHESSGFLLQTSTPDRFERVTTSLTVEQFTGLCRTLDIGAKYQDYLKSNLQPKDTVADQVLRENFITAQKTALRAAAETALLKKDIGPADYTSILSIIAGETAPYQGNRQIWFRDLGLMRHRMTGCVVFTICEKYRYSDDLILYIPNDPHHPLKRYTYAEMQATFKQRFTARDGADPDDIRPTAYQQFFSQFVAYADRPDYFYQLTDDKSTSFSQHLTPYAPILNELWKGISPLGALVGVKELPPASPTLKKPNDDPFLDPGGILHKGKGLWEANPDLWAYLFEQHRAKVIADARSHAVPTADVDARVRSEKLSRLLNIGMLVLTGVAMFVPVLGEVMMVVMAGQLLEETFEGVIEWSEGDRKAAKAHLIDVAENLALLAVTAGVGKGLAKWSAVRAEPVIERLDPVTRPNGQLRLWSPELGRYESPANLDHSTGPNTQGQHQLDGKTYIRQADKVYETIWDESLQHWRIKHPTDPDAYQPVLTHNGAGAWRHTLERPLAWDRLTLLRRMGHVTEGFTDSQLLDIADVSGVSDNTLRKMHLDNAPLPPELADTLRLFEADRDVAAVIRQMATGEFTDARSLAALPLVTELPRWPVGRVLRVFDDPRLTGPSVKYGAERLSAGVRRKPAIRVSQADVLNGQLPARILAALDEPEITGLLGGEPARVHEGRLGEFRKQMADYLESRQPTVFENLYRSKAPLSPEIVRLQKLHPGLGESAAQSVLAGADADQLTRLQDTGRLPLPMQEQARWHVRQGRLSHAYAGLLRDNMVSADSPCLALQALTKLPGWSDQVRLEIREGHIEGPLLEGIGAKTSTSRKYLVKKGPFYQAFNERGEALNSLPRKGDNFYQSVMHALPDDARQALGFPETGQNQALRKAVVDYALAHRAQMARLLEERSARAGRIKPPTRVGQARIGYYASGDGPALDLPLISRVRDVYPSLTDQQANGYILKLRRAGQTDAQIFGHLQARLREWETLESTLEQWLQPGAGGVNNSLFGGRTVVENIKACWRNAPLVDEDPRFARLEVVHMGTLPAITADFSHVRDLTLMASSSEALLTYFPNVEKLQLDLRFAEAVHAFEALGGMHKLSSLHVWAPPSPALLSGLSALIQLEELNLVSARGIASMLEEPAYDLSAFKQLRRLEITEPQMKQWPTGLLELPRLERLNLRRTGIDSLPAAIEGQERLMAGLSLDWSKFPREVFKPVYERVSGLPRHLIDLEEMVGDYCRGELRRISGLNVDVLSSKFAAQWQGAQARFDAIETLGSQLAELERELSEWMSISGSSSGHLSAASSLRTCWRNGLFRRYGSTTGVVNLDALYGQMADSSVLELPFLQLNTIPRLPTEGFTHVKTLRLLGLQGPAEQVRGFIRGFSALKTLDLTGSGATDLPLTRGDLPSLEHLNLRACRLTRLDVGGLDSLQSLNLMGSALEAWPTGAENLPQLNWLDLRDTRVATLPQTMLSQDTILLGTNLMGAPLTPQTQAALFTALRRVEGATGLADGTLNRFALQPVPEEFPPVETGASISGQLLSLLPAETSENPLSLEHRLHRLFPALEAQESRQLIEQMRAKGATELQLHERINGWNQMHEMLPRQLNDWLFIRESRSNGWIVSAQSRHLAAVRIMDCWRKGLLADGAVETELNLSGLQLGDLPELAVAFSHVDTLNLTGVRLSGQGSNGFLRGFSQLRALALSANDLRVLPDAVESLRGLQWLELSGNGISDPEPLYRSLAAHEELQWLDLSHNDLETFNVSQFERLETLDLRNNRLTDWPEGALQGTNLRALNLSYNDVNSIPAQALDGNHELLMAGTNLSDNFNLSRESLERLRVYAENNGRNSALGLTANGIDLLIEELDSDFEGASDTESVVPDEDLSDYQVAPGQQEAWFESVEPQVLAEHRALWNQLEAEPDHEAFFHLLLRLQDTQEFRLARADLTRRVWDVLNAAVSNTELRQTLFGLSNTHGTCVDGRILTFSGLEIKVFEHNALLDIDPANLEQKGAALLKLSRRLFRLDRVEELAAKAPSHHHDPAEARLEYRIGLKDALDLPGQPKNMSFGRPVTGKTLSDAIDEVQRAERSDRFYEDLASRPYWVQYLEEKYPEVFRTLEREAAERNDQLEDDHPQITSIAYGEALEALGIELAIERNQKLIELSRIETGEIERAVSSEPQPGTSKGFSGKPQR